MHGLPISAKCSGPQPIWQNITGAASGVRRWFPFSAGQRDCIGQNLARMNYTTTVAMLLARFSLRLAVPVSSYLQDGCLVC